MRNSEFTDIFSSTDTPRDIWQSTTIEEASLAARATYGPSARTAVAWCAITARTEGRAGDFRFWFDVFTHLGGSGT